MTPTLRVAHVIPSVSARTGGPAVSVLQLSVALSALGVKTEIFTTDLASAASAPTLARLGDTELNDLRRKTVINVAPARTPLRFAYAPSLRKELDRRNMDFDVIHIHGLYLYPQYAAYRIARTRKLPYVISIRGILDRYMRSRNRLRKAIVDVTWQHAMLRKAAAIHVTSTAECDATSDSAPRVPRAIVPNPVDWRAYVDLPDKRVFIDRFLGGGLPHVVMYLGRVSHKKGLPVLIAAFAQVAPSHPDAILAIVGPDDEGLLPELRSLAASLGVSSKSRFVDYVSGPEKLAALASATVWVLPSMTENFGVAVVEALAAGVPVILSEGVAIGAELAAAGACVVCAATPAALAVEIASLLEDQLRRESLSRAARLAAQRFSPETVAEQMLKVYRTIAMTKIG